MFGMNNVFSFLSAMEYHSDADFNSSRVGVVVVVKTVKMDNSFTEEGEI